MGIAVRILLYGLNFAPELTGIGKYTGEMARWLVEQGHEVRVVTAPPYYPEWRVHSGHAAGAYRREWWHGVDVIRCPLWVPKRVSGLKRLLHLASFAISSLPALLAQWRWRPKLVWTVEPALFGTPGALLVAKLTGARSWLHIQDYEVDAAFAMGLLRGERLRRAVLGIERWLMRRFDVVSTISGRMLELAARKGIPEDRLVLFPNWVDISDITPLERASTYREMLRIPSDAVVALYSGNMGAKQGLEVLAAAAQALQQDKNIVFVFCGDGAGKEALARECEGLPNVRLLPLQPFERLNELLGAADIHLLPQRADAADLVLPSKLTGMLASGRPVIATADPATELGQLLQRTGCGLLVPPGDAPAIVQAIRELAADSGSRRLMGQAGRNHAQAELDIETILLRFVERVSGAPTASVALQPHV